MDDADRTRTGDSRKYISADEAVALIQPDSRAYPGNSTVYGGDAHGYTDYPILAA
jgi:hypothetical protein